MFTFPLSIFGGSRKVFTGNLGLIGSAGTTQLVSSSLDDHNTLIPDIGFNFPFYGINYRTNIYVGSNSYITFGYSSNAYNSLSYTNPGRGIFIDSGDRSYTKVFVIGTSDTYRIRFEGDNGTGGTVGSPTRVWETTLFSDGVIQIVIGVISINSTSYLTKGTGTDGEFVNFTITANSSTVLIPTSTNYISYSNSYYA